MGDNAKVDINGENRGLLDALRKSQQAVKEFAESADRSLKTLSNIGKVGAGAFGLEYTYEVAKHFVEIAAEHEQAGIRFGLAMRNMGKESHETMDDVRALSEAMRETTTYTDMQTKEAVRATMSMGIFTSGINDVVKVSADLAAMMGQELPQAAHELGYALLRPEYGMRMLMRQGIAFTAQQREMIRSLSHQGDLSGAREYMFKVVSQQSAGAAATMRDSGAGAMQLFQNELREAGIEFGKSILELFVKHKAAFMTIANVVMDAGKVLALSVVALGDLLDHLPGVGGWKSQAEMNRQEQERNFVHQRELAFRGSMGVTPEEKAQYRDRYAVQDAMRARDAMNAAQRPDASGHFSDDAMREWTRQRARMHRDASMFSGGEGGMRAAMAAIDAQKKGPTFAAEDQRPFKAQIEDLTAMNKRITEAAASRFEGEEGEKTTNDVVTSLEKINDTLKDHLPEIKKNTDDAASASPPLK